MARHTKYRDREVPAMPIEYPFASFRNVTSQYAMPFWTPTLRKVMKKRVRNAGSRSRIPIPRRSNGCSDRTGGIPGRKRMLESSRAASP